MIGVTAEISSFSGSTTEKYMELLTHPAMMSSLIALSRLPVFSADFVLEFKNKFGKEMRPTQNQATDLEQCSTAGSTTERGWNRRGKDANKASGVASTHHSPSQKEVKKNLEIDLKKEAEEGEEEKAVRWIDACN